mmetsp:Transcript_51115/g.141437  ORF Transcript_51115/g.141437 Transcript_51115/m.141437 type:complete len:210 (-) Transcript_51115:274-903(-)
MACGWSGQSRSPAVAVARVSCAVAIVRSALCREGRWLCALAPCRVRCRHRVVALCAHRPPAASDHASAMVRSRERCACASSVAASACVSQRCGSRVFVPSRKRVTQKKRKTRAGRARTSTCRCRRASLLDLVSSPAGGAQRTCGPGGRPGALSSHPTLPATSETHVVCGGIAGAAQWGGARNRVVQKPTEKPNSSVVALSATVEKPAPS